MAPLTRHVLSLVLLAAATAAAQSPSRQLRPARDTAARRPVGTASIAGHVLAGDTGRPLARARVTISASDSGINVSTLTDQAGTYAVTDLPAGAYTVTASKVPFVTLAWGARRPQGPGRRLALKDAQQAREVDIRLPRGSVIAGRVYDDSGEPIVRATVQAMRHQYLQGEPRLVGSGSAQTDDRGQFRIWGLSPGTYVVTAAARLDGRAEASERGNASLAQSYAPTYYPGVTNPADAGYVTLDVQQEAPGIDFVLQLVPTSRVSGSVVSDVAGGPSPSVILATDDPRGVTAGSTYSARVQDDGTFVIDGVPPGRYLAIARAGRGGRGASPTFVGIAPVFVAGQDVAGVSIQITAGATISGWITADSATGQRVDPAALRLATSPPVPLPFVGRETARVQPDGSFVIQNVVGGAQLLRLEGAPRGWALKGIYLNGRDVSDQVLDVKNGQALGGIQVVLSDRPTTLSGTVVDEESQAVLDCYVVAFSTDQSTWRPRSRSIQGIRPGQDGTFTASGLPPGEYYLAVVDDIEPGAWAQPSVLEELRKTATRVSVGEGETKVVTLRYGATER